MTDPKPLAQGDRLRAVYVPKEADEDDGIRRALEQDEEIVVVMEHGQNSLVPWAALYVAGVERCRYNLSLCLGVERMLEADQ